MRRAGAALVLLLATVTYYAAVRTDVPASRSGRGPGRDGQLALRLAGRDTEVIESAVQV